MFNRFFIVYSLYPWLRNSVHSQRLSVLDMTVKQQKVVHDSILREVVVSHNGWARAKMCSEAQKDLTRATAWSKPTGAAGMEWGKNSPNDIISCYSVLVCLSGLSSTGVSDCLTQKEHIFWVIIAYFEILCGSWALVGPAVNCCLRQMGPGDSADQSCIFGWHRVYWLEQKNLSVGHE